jgi:hypothetical protein
VLVHFGRQRGHFIGELWQRGGVAFGELADAAGEGLGDAVQLALHGGGEGSEPFIIHDEGLDLGLGEFGILVVGEPVEFFLCLFDLCPDV